jgi:hypothetical protein
VSEARCHQTYQFYLGRELKHLQNVAYVLERQYLTLLVVKEEFLLRHLDRAHFRGRVFVGLQL